MIPHELRRLTHIRVFLPHRTIVEAVLLLKDVWVVVFVTALAILAVALIYQWELVHARMGRLLGLQLPEVEPDCSRHYRGVVQIRFVVDGADFIHGFDQIFGAIQIILR